VSIDACVAFIVGSPRSGTTVLGEVLDAHPQIAQWYEPYFIWGRHLDLRDTDIREAWEATSETKRFVRGEFEYFRDRSGKDLVAEKSPDHSFHVPLVHAVFPDARWIHILRDGRDVTLSIHKEWEKRRRMVERNDYRLLLASARTMIFRQRFWRHRLMALHYEIRHTNVLKPRKILNKAKWRGEVGWGPRFEGWRDVLKKNSTLRFNAYQWLHTVESARKGLSAIPNHRVMEIRYEDFISHPEAVLGKLFGFLEVCRPARLNERIPQLKAGNFNKWQKEFSHEQISDFGPVVTSELIELGYESDLNWFEKSISQSETR
jgi:hypothetical protein